MKRTLRNVFILTFIQCLVSLAIAQTADPLPSWNDGEAKRSIIEFASKATKQGTSSFVPVEARIAIFDDHGTLWAEQPLYVQLLFAIDRVKTLAPQHPEWEE